MLAEDHHFRHRAMLADLDADPLPRIGLGRWESGDLGVILELWKFTSP